MALNFIEKKPIVIEILKEKGPSLPSDISSKIGLSLLFTSALLSEMVAEKIIKFSHLKVGGSPLYYLPGQEQMIENFSKYLHSKEREVLELLKEKQVLLDENLEPVQRVCLNSTKDFSYPIKINYGNEQKLFWRYLTVSEEEAVKKAQEYLKNLEKIQPKEPDKKITEFEKPDEIQETIKKLKEEKVIKPIKERIEEKTEETKQQIEEQKILHPEFLKKKTRKKSLTKKKKDFINKVFDYLKEKEILILKNFEEENKVCIAQMDSILGPLNFLVYVIQKKSLNESDLSLAFAEGQHERLPVLLVTNGKLTKKAEEYYKKLGNFLIMHKI